MGDITAANQSARSKPDTACDAIKPDCAKPPVSKVLKAYFAKKKETLSGKAKSLSFLEISEGMIADKVFVIVETSGLLDAEMEITILGSNNTTFVKPDEALSLAQGALKATVGNYSKRKEYNNAASFTDMAVLEVELKPAGTGAKDWSKKISDSAEKKAFLHLTVTTKAGTDTEYTVDDDKLTPPSKDKGIFLNKANQWFQFFGCHCSRDFSAIDMLNLIYWLRDKQGYKTFRESFFEEVHDEMLTSLSNTPPAKLEDALSKVETFTTAMNAMFTKFEINSCKRKIHFLAQMYLETKSFRASCESTSSLCKNYKGGCDFRGRGMKQITHDYNYLGYYDYVNSTTYFQTYMQTRQGYDSVGETIDKLKGLTDAAIGKKYKGKACDDQCVAQINEFRKDSFYTDLKTFTSKLSTELFSAMDSAGWFSTINAPTSVAAMDKGLGDANVIEVTKIINGGSNNIEERKNFTGWLKDYFRYDTICVNK